MKVNVSLMFSSDFLEVFDGLVEYLEDFCSDVGCMLIGGTVEEVEEE